MLPPMATRAACRYGANALAPADATSSYDAIDMLVEALLYQFPALTHLTIVGHSSGGQFVQRYALTSTAPFWNGAWSTPGSHPVESGSGAGASIRAIVANPSSFAYLDARRWEINPAHSALPVLRTNRSWATSCPDYNQWEFGLEEGAEMKSAPYVQRALARAGSVGALVSEYANRDLIYLAGAMDKCNVAVGWCKSHGLETTCADQLQGRTRLERSRNYYTYLTAYYGRAVHRWVEVPGVGHDHALMFESEAGVAAIFGTASPRGSSQIPHPPARWSGYPSGRIAIGTCSLIFGGAFVFLLTKIKHFVNQSLLRK
jgi:pimeloyl-ACP methyl ester carboxylesterase